MNNGEIICEGIPEVLSDPTEVEREYRPGGC